MLDRTYTITRIGGRDHVVERTPGGDMRRVGIIEPHPTPEHGEHSCIIRTVAGVRLGIAATPDAALAYLRDRAEGQRFAAVDIHRNGDDVAEALYLLAVEHDIEPMGLPFLDIERAAYVYEQDEGWMWQHYDEYGHPDVEPVLALMRAAAAS